jgi:hypothetical protein
MYRGGNFTIIIHRRTYSTAGTTVLHHVLTLAEWAQAGEGGSRDTVIRAPLPAGVVDGDGDAGDGTGSRDTTP